jgi:hypothetical protein
MPIAVYHYYTNSTVLYQFNKKSRIRFPFPSELILEAPAGFRLSACIALHPLHASTPNKQHQKRSHFHAPIENLPTLVGLRTVSRTEEVTGVRMLRTCMLQSYS